jgi:glycine cleavage system regulatory protein
MSAEQLFEATASLRLPADVDLDALRLALEDIANELMVDLDVGPRTPPTTERG